MAGASFDTNAEAVPKFVNTDYIELVKIERISRFRSAVGHNYSDSFESCRSMKHYFQPTSSVDWGSVRIRSPVNGEVIRLQDEWAGTQVAIRSREHRAFLFMIFHVRLASPLAVGDVVKEGQVLGTHVGSQTMSDVAVGMDTPKGYRLVSYFDVMTDALFARYQERGIKARDALIISKADRDADPLTCQGEAFQGQGKLPNWVP